MPVNLDVVKPGKTESSFVNDLPKPGEWYWVTTINEWKDPPEPERWLGCVMEVGSNYALLEGVGQRGKRVHFDDFRETCEREENWREIIDGKIGTHSRNARALMGEVQELTARLGIGKRDSLTDGTEAHALVRASAAPINEYKQELILAKEKTLPDLFKRIEEENKEMAAWMKMPILPLRVQSYNLHDTLEQIESRIFNVELYAGLVETVVQCAAGEPASLTAPLHLFQRRHYMDEECLAEYEAGGMEFDGLPEFDKWLARPSNLNRIFPFPRTVVAFQVRRLTKERERAVDLRSFFALREKEKLDKTTFLYFRNGENLYRLNTQVEFGEKLFPDLERLQLSQRMYAHMFADRVQGLLTEGEFLERKKQYGRNWKKYEARNYALYEPNNIFYDDISKYIAEEMTEHNRIVLVLQGLLDRSPVFHPHPPWQLFTHEGFQVGVRLIFDDDRALTSGDKPDFEAYRNTLNGELTTGSWTIGQMDVWLRAEAKKEIRRLDRIAWRLRNTDYRYMETFHPEGDPGPGWVAQVKHFSKRARKCTFEWEREPNPFRRRRRFYTTPPERLDRSIIVGVDDLFNVDAYQPGDFRIFFSDPRTRAEYLKWAPFLLRAEDFKKQQREMKLKEPG